jgi:tetratricopeptide (TPR) repeat protein
MTKARFILLISSLATLAIAGCRSAHTTSAILYIKEQRYDKAINVLHEGLSYNPDEPDAYYWLGEAHSSQAEVDIQDDNFLEAQKNYELAYKYYKKAEELDPAKFTEQSNLAMQHNYTLRKNDASREYRDGYYEQAEGYFRLAYAALPDSLSSIKSLARMKIKMASENNNDPATLEEALDLLNQVLAVHPNAYELNADKASVLASLGRVSEANAIYDELIKDHGDDPALLIDIANLAIDQGQTERAADLFVRVANIYENDSDTENDAQIKDLLLKAGTWLAADDVRRYDDALELFDRALGLEVVPEQNTQFEYLRTFYNYGSWLKQQADQETDAGRKAELLAKAKEKFSRGVEVGNALVQYYPDYPFGYYYLFLCQEELGDSAAAQQNFNKFRELQNLGE